MSYSDQYGNFYGVMNDDGNVDVFHVEDGLAATRMDCNIYTVDSDGSKSVRYEHVYGITISLADAKKIGLDIEE